MPHEGEVFQSTHLHEVRCVKHVCYETMLKISIHAPARGAIQLREPYPVSKSFQSTHLHEVRSVSFAGNCLDSYFNPRTCTRCDEYSIRRNGHESISIHAPARGAIQVGHADGSGRQISIHAPARGAMRSVSNLQLHLHISIHAPARGAIFFSSIRLSI